MNVAIHVSTSNRAKAISFIITFALQLAVCSAYYEYSVVAISAVPFVCFVYPAHTSLHFCCPKDYISLLAHLIMTGLHFHLPLFCCQQYNGHIITTFQILDLLITIIIIIMVTFHSYLIENRACDWNNILFVRIATALSGRLCCT